MVSDEHFREAGFTSAAAAYPRDELSFILLCAFNGIDPSIAPDAFRYFPNEATKQAWLRVAEAARRYISEESEHATVQGYTHQRDE